MLVSLVLETRLNFKVTPTLFKSDPLVKKLIFKILSTSEDF